MIIMLYLSLRLVRIWSDAGVPIRPQSAKSTFPSKKSYMWLYDYFIIYKKPRKKSLRASAPANVTPFRCVKHTTRATCQSTRLDGSHAREVSQSSGVSVSGKRNAQRT